MFSISLKIMIGDAGSGKTERMVREMAESSLRFPEDRFFAVVPEQATLMMQWSVVRHVKNGATLNIDVVSFNRLAQVVFADLGIDVSRVLDDTGKVLILRQILEVCREDLCVYRSKVRMPGFSQKIKSAVTELKQYGLTDNDLFLMQESAEEKGNRLLFGKLQDLRLILSGYQEKIRDAYRSSEELLPLFASVVKDSERIRNSHIYLDGFTGFTPVQYQLLEELLRYAGDVTITLTIPPDRVREPCPAYDLFALSNQTLFRLKEAAAAAGVSCDVIPQQTEPSGSGRVCRIVPAADSKEEVTFAAKEILRLVRDEGLRFRDIAVVTCDMEAYHSVIEKTFREAGIPCFIDHKEGIAEHPLSVFCLSAFRLKEDHFSYDSLFSFLKTGLTDLSRDEIDQLENYCLEFGIHGFRAFEKPMERNRKLRGPEPTEEERKENPYAGFFYDLDQINSIRSKVYDILSGFLSEIRGKERSPGVYVRALKGLLRKNRIEEKMTEKGTALGEQGYRKEQKTYEQVFELVTGLLDKTELLSGEEKISVREFMNMLESGLSEIRIGVIPPTIDSLVAGDLTRTRLDRVQVLFLIGADESRIPAAASPPGIFSAKEREFLKTQHFEIAPTKMENIYQQRFYLYLMLKKPERCLYLSYARNGADGEQQGPSYLFEELGELIPEVRRELAGGMPEIKWERQALSELTGNIRKEPEEALLAFFAGKDPVLLRKIVDAAFYTNRQTPLDPQVALDLYGEVLSGSVSRYEKFSECPFKHYLSYGIRLEKRPEYEIAATDVGTLYHSALEHYSVSLSEKGYSFRDVPEEESRKIALESVEKALEEIPTDIMDSSARNEFMRKRITDVTVKTTDILRAQVRAGLFEPDRYEMDFRDTLNEKVRFKGKIDRVDVYDAGDLFVKIIDYKSGPKAFRIQDIYSGLSLQLVAYLKEAVSVYEKENPGKRVRPGGVYYYLIHDRFSKDAEEARDRFKLSGLTSCEEGLLPAMDQALSAAEAESHIVHVKLKKDGEPTAASDIANDREFASLMDFVGGKIEEISSRILRGEIEPEPFYEQARTNACLYCEYKDVCKFEAGNFGTDWKKKPELSKKEMEAEIYGRI